MSDLLSIIVPKSNIHDITDLFTANKIHYSDFLSNWDKEVTRLVAENKDLKIDDTIQKGTAIIAMSIWIQETNRWTIPAFSSNSRSNKPLAHATLQPIVESINKTISKFKNGNKWEWVKECETDPLIIKIDEKIDQSIHVKINPIVLRRILLHIIGEKRKTYIGIMKVLQDPPKDSLTLVRELAAATAGKKNPVHRGGFMKGGVSPHTNSVALAFAGLGPKEKKSRLRRTRKNKKIY